MMCRIKESKRTADDGQCSELVPRPPSFALVLVLCSVWWLAGCSSTGTLQIMGDQPRYDPYEASSAFSDGMSARPVVSDTLTFMQPMSDTLLYPGVFAGKARTTFPFPGTRAALE